MLDQISAIYCISDELLKTLNYKDDPQCKMSTAEIMTFSIMSAMIYGCNYKTTRLVSKTQKFFKNILSHSQIVRRIHQIPEHIWMLFFGAMQCLLRNKDQNCFIVDSFPVKAYENHKSFRAKIFSGKEYHGYSSSRKQYFFGIKVHMIINSDGVPIEFSFTPGSHSDSKSLQNMSVNLPKGSLLLADKAYTNYQFEDLLKEVPEIELIAKRRSNLKRQHSIKNERILSKNRGYIETVFSCITRRMPRSIEARTEKGFCLKVLFFILAHMCHLFHPLA